VSETAPGSGVLLESAVAHAGAVRLTVAVHARDQRIIVAGLIRAVLAWRRPAATRTDQIAARGSVGAGTAAAGLGAARGTERRRPAANQCAIDSARSPAASAAGVRALDRIEGSGCAGAAAGLDHGSATPLDAFDGAETIGDGAVGRVAALSAGRTGRAAASSRVRLSRAARCATQDEGRKQGKRQRSVGFRGHAIDQTSPIRGDGPGRAMPALQRFSWGLPPGGFGAALGRIGSASCSAESTAVAAKRGNNVGAPGGRVATPPRRPTWPMGRSVGPPQELHPARRGIIVARFARAGG
jgi:hypothetical protein